MIPKKMFRAHDRDLNRGNLFLLESENGADCMILWRPDSDDLEQVRAASIHEILGMILNEGLTLYREIPVEEGTEQISVIQSSFNASPNMKPASRG